jgi:hypothetical protein
MNWLLLLLTLETGFIGTGGTRIQDAYYFPPANSVYADIDIHAQMWNFWHIKGAVRTDMQLPINSEPWFTPYSMTYSIETWLSVYFIDIGVRHFCQHPVVTTYNPIPSNFEDSTTEFYIRGNFLLIGKKE